MQNTMIKFKFTELTYDIITITKNIRFFETNNNL